MLPGTPSAARTRRPGLRRALLCASLAAIVALPMAVSGCGSDSKKKDTPVAEETGPIELSVMWWGAETRAKLTHEALALYTKKHPNVTFKETWQTNTGYYDKLMTLVSGNSTPDIFQIDDNYLSEYAQKKVTLDLTPYKDSKTIDVSKFPESLWKYGVVKNKLSAIAWAENTQCIAYDKTALQKANQPEPTIGQSWEDHIKWAIAAGKATGVAGTMDPSADYKAFWVWLRGQGKDMYKDDDLGFTKEDVVKWFDLWKSAREQGATPTADVIHQGNASDVTKQLVVTGKALTSWVWCNQLPELAKNTKSTLGLVSYPGDPKSQWARAALYLAASAKTQHARTVASVLNFLVNDPEAGKVLGTERGLPANTDIRAQVAATVTDENMKASINIENELGKKFGPSPAVPIKGHSTIRTELTKAAEKVQFNQATSDKSAEDFMSACKTAIKW